jgi:hypothetical protein
LPRSPKSIVFIVSKESGASQTYPYFRLLGLDSPKRKIWIRVLLHCLCLVFHDTQTQQRKQPSLKIPLFFCEVSKFTVEEQSEECAFSDPSDFSRKGRAKIRKNSQGTAFLAKICNFEATTLFNSPYRTETQGIHPNVPMNGFAKSRLKKPSLAKKKPWKKSRS